MKKTQLIVWLDYENGFHKRNIELIPKHKNIEVKSYISFKESIRTPLECKKFLEINNPKEIKYRSDLARVLILYNYGGIYYDLDMILLKDLSPLFDLEFCYQWSTELRNKGNNGILRLKKYSDICKHMMNKYIIE